MEGSIILFNSSFALFLVSPAANSIFYSNIFTDESTLSALFWFSPKLLLSTSLVPNCTYYFHFHLFIPSDLLKHCIKNWSAERNWKSEFSFLFRILKRVAGGNPWVSNGVKYWNNGLFYVTCTNYWLNVAFDSLCSLSSTLSCLLCSHFYHRMLCILLNACSRSLDFLTCVYIWMICSYCYCIYYMRM